MRDHGFTLVEALLAVLLSAVALTTGLHLLLQAVIATHTARDQSVAVWLAQAQRERLRADPAAVNGVDVVTSGGAPDVHRGRYRRSWTVAHVGGGRRVRVQVCDARGRVLVTLDGGVSVP